MTTFFNFLIVLGVIGLALGIYALRLPNKNNSKK